jgi:arylsulfatase
MRHLRWARLLSASLLCHAWVNLGGVGDAAERPNIIVILTDDMGFSDIGCYGSEIDTPHLDALAAGGLRFTQCYNTARCCPTRASLLTGLYPHQAGMGHMTGRANKKLKPAYVNNLNRRSVTIAEALRPAGYRTYAVGKWHVTPDNSRNPNPKRGNWPLQRGFDRYYGTIAGGGSYYDPVGLVKDNEPISPFADPDYKPANGFYYTDAIADHAVTFIDDHQRDHADQPFFMYVAFTAAHWPMHAREDAIAKYHGRYDAGYDAIRAARLAKAQRLGVLDSQWELTPRAGHDYLDGPHREWELRSMETSAAVVDALDQGVGRVVDALDRHRLAENTLVLYLQDNGGCAEAMGRRDPQDIGPQRADHPTRPVQSADMLRRTMVPDQTRDGYPIRQGVDVMPGPADTFQGYGEAWANVSNTPFRQYKHWVHEGGISTPLIARWPAGIAARGEFRRDPCHLIDVMATCVDLTGAQYPQQKDGKKIQPMAGVSLRPAFQGKPLNRGKPIFFEHEGNRAVRDGQWKLVAKGPGGKWELYDMNADRTELHDLAAQHPQRVEKMAAQWEAWAKRVKAIPWPWKPQYKPAAQPARAASAS